MREKECRTPDLGVSSIQKEKWKARNLTQLIKKSLERLKELQWQQLVVFLEMQSSELMQLLMHVFRYEEQYFSMLYGVKISFIVRNLV